MDLNHARLPIPPFRHVSEELVLDPNNFACSLISVPNPSPHVKPRTLRAFYETWINLRATICI
jgi:hypothetical protein